MGAIYTAIQNLPREERYSSENILTGVIPGPREPKVMNSYLRPLLDELKQDTVMNCASRTPVIVHAALLCCVEFQDLLDTQHTVLAHVV